jgi:hypothetical protein
MLVKFGECKYTKFYNTILLVKFSDYEIDKWLILAKKQILAQKHKK